MLTPEVTNSTSYADMLGVLSGLQRFPGELTDDFVDRIRRASRLDRGATYSGFLNELNLQFGLSPFVAFDLFFSNDAPSVTCTLAGLVLAGLDPIPLIVMGSDGLWAWRKISDIVNDINAAGAGYYAILRKDGPAIQIVDQTNRILRTTTFSGRTLPIVEGRLDAGSETFDADGLSYSVIDNTLIFTSPVPDNTSASYACFQTPYKMLGFPAAAFDLSGAGILSEVSKYFDKTGDLPYQVKEYVQQVMRTDRSYWGL